MLPVCPLPACVHSLASCIADSQAGDFIASPTSAGVRPGYHYRHGPLGPGYYRLAAQARG